MENHRSSWSGDPTWSGNRAQMYYFLSGQDWKFRKKVNSFRSSKSSHHAGVTCHLLLGCSWKPNAKADLCYIIVVRFIIIALLTYICTMVFQVTALATQSTRVSSDLLPTTPPASSHHHHHHNTNITILQPHLPLPCHSAWLVDLLLSS
jgi:hypothetical protein